MAGVTPTATIPPDIMKIMQPEELATIVEQFLTHSGKTEHECTPPPGKSAFTHYYQIVATHNEQSKHDKANAVSKAHADKATAKALQASTAEATVTPLQSATDAVFTSPECIAALRKFTSSDRVANTGALLATVPEPARAVMTAKFDSDSGAGLRRSCVACGAAAVRDRAAEVFRFP